MNVELRAARSAATVLAVCDRGAGVRRSWNCRGAWPPPAAPKARVDFRLAHRRFDATISNAFPINISDILVAQKKW